jgi:hypothetical protein
LSQIVGKESPLPHCIITQQNAVLKLWFNYQQWHEFSLLQRFQTGSGAHPASYLLGTVSPYPGHKVAGSWSWQLTRLSVYIAIPPHLIIPSWYDS